MPTNIEIKARMHDRARIEPIVLQHATRPVEQLRQEDIFFNTPQGRLKLRIINGTRAELIQYERADTPGPRSSRYTVVPIEQPAELRRALADAHGECGTVCKERRVYMIGHTRVHLDSVSGLGDFIELEVVLTGEETGTDGIDTARKLMADLGIADDDLIDCAYVDLLYGNTRLERATARL